MVVAIIVLPLRWKNVRRQELSGRRGAEADGILPQAGCSSPVSKPVTSPRPQRRAFVLPRKAAARRPGYIIRRDPRASNSPRSIGGAFLWRPFLPQHRSGGCRGTPAASVVRRRQPRREELSRRWIHRLDRI